MNRLPSTSLLLGVAALGCCLLASPPAQAQNGAQNILQDGGFENTNFNNASGGTYSAAGTSPGSDSATFNGGDSLGDDWSVTQGSITIEDAAASQPINNPAPYSGDYDAYLDDFSYPTIGEVNTLSQTLATTPGQTYTVSFHAADDGVDLLTVDFGSDQLYSGSSDSRYNGTPSRYAAYSFTATAISASTPLTFTGEYTDGSFDGTGTALDNVSVTPLSASPAPEPPAMGLFALMAAGLGGLTLRARRKTDALEG